jgi:membrane protease YdiL (CAAX protease family)
VLSRLPQVGLALHGALLTAIILHAALFAHDARQKLLITLALGPLIRLMSLTLPLQDFPLIYWYAMIGAPLFLAAFLVYRFVRSGPAKVRVNGRGLPLQVLVGLTGLGLGYLEYRILKPAPLIPSLTWERILLPAFILFFFTGMLEEVIFRGLIQRSATASLGRYGMLYSALWFAVLHLGYRSILDVIFVFVVAIFFGMVVARTSSLFGVTMAHGLTNISLYLVIPFLIQTPSPTITAPWVNIIPTAQRIMIVTPTLTATPTVPTPTVPTPTSSLTPTASPTATRYLLVPSFTPTFVSTSPSGGKTPTRPPAPTHKPFTPTSLPVTPAPQNTPVPVTPAPQETPVPPTPVPDTPMPPDTPIPPTTNPTP